MNVPGDGEIRLPDFINSNRKYEKIKKLSRMGNHFFDDCLRHYWLHGIRLLFFLFPRRVYCFPLCGESMNKRRQIADVIAAFEKSNLSPMVWKDGRLWAAIGIYPPINYPDRRFRIKTKI